MYEYIVYIVDMTRFGGSVISGVLMNVNLNTRIFNQHPIKHNNAPYIGEGTQTKISSKNLDLDLFRYQINKDMQRDTKTKQMIQYYYWYNRIQ